MGSTACTEPQCLYAAYESGPLWRLVWTSIWRETDDAAIALAGVEPDAADNVTSSAGFRI